jgi:uncharacterized Tic20 family protein
MNPQVPLDPVPRPGPDPAPAPGVPPPAASPGGLSPSDERTMAMLAHLSNLLNLVSGFLGLLVPLGLYLLYKDRSRYVAYQSLQSFIFQLIWWAGAGAVAVGLWVMSGLLSVVLIGCLLMPLAAIASLVPLASMIYSIYAGVECSQGRDFRYWLIGDWVRDTYTA